MLQDLVRAVGALRDPLARGPVWRGIALALVTLIALGIGVEALLGWAADTRWTWLDWLIQALGVFGSLVVAWFLFPSLVVAISAIFLDPVVDAVEDRHYPGSPPTRRVGLGEAIPAAARLLGIVLLLNLLALPLYFIPFFNLPIWLLLNGYLVGREYFELVALRRHPGMELPRLRRSCRTQFWLAGIVIAFLLTVPVLNLVAPVIGAAFMTHRFHRVCGPRITGTIVPA